jgi:hypothetical protein
MKKFLVLAASLLLAAAPAAAQQDMESGAAPVVTAPAAAAPTPSVDARLFPTRDQVRQQVAQAEARHARAPMGSSEWWYTVAAVALGVVIALLLLD